MRLMLKNVGERETYGDTVSSCVTGERRRGSLFKPPAAQLSCLRGSCGQDQLWCLKLCMPHNMPGGEIDFAIARSSLPRQSL